MLTSIIAGLIGALLGVILTVVGILMIKNSAFSTIITSIGTSILTASVIGIVYESFQKQVLAGDVSKAFGVSQSLKNTGIQSVSDPDTKLLASLLRSGEVDIMPLSTVEWYGNYKTLLLDAACERKTAINLWSPEYDHESLADLLAPPLNITSTEISRKFKAFLQEIERDWDAAPILAGSTLTVRSYRGMPSIGVYRGNSRSIIEYQQAPPTGLQIARPRWIEVEPSGTFENWIRAEFSKVSGSSSEQIRLIKSS